MLRYLYNILVACSHLLNALLLGSPHESISVRTGKAMEHDRCGWYRHHAYFINWMFRTFLGEENHLSDAVNGEDKAIELWSWTKGK